MNRYRIEPLQATALDQIIRLRMRVFGGSERITRAYLNWKYIANPYLPDPLIYVARDRGEIVGMRGWFGTSWSVPGLNSLQVLPCAAETAITPDHRDQGIFADLTDFSMDALMNKGFGYAINMSATPANYLTSIITMGWKSVDRYEFVSKSTDSGSAMRSGHQSAGESAGSGTLLRQLPALRDPKSAFAQVQAFGRKVFGPYSKTVLDKKLSTVPMICVSSEPDVTAMARIAEQFDDKTRICHSRDAAYIKWRYSNPLSSYRFVWPRSDKPKAFLVLQEKDARSFRLVDWAGDEDSITGLVANLVAQTPTVAISTWVNALSEPEKRRLHSLGFQNDPDEGRTGLLIRSLLLEKENWLLGRFRLLDKASWNLRMIFSDRY
jgi:hypothetical protein